MPPANEWKRMAAQTKIPVKVSNIGMMFLFCLCLATTWNIKLLLHPIYLVKYFLGYSVMFNLESPGSMTDKNINHELVTDHFALLVWTCAVWMRGYRSMRYKCSTVWMNALNCAGAWTTLVSWVTHCILLPSTVFHRACSSPLFTVCLHSSLFV